jgi:hypothetical protein
VARLWNDGPPELFVSEVLASEALDFFLDSGKQKPDLRWIRIDEFSREIVWEGRHGREAWEKAKPTGYQGDA